MVPLARAVSRGVLGGDDVGKYRVDVGDEFAIWKERSQYEHSWAREKNVMPFILQGIGGFGIRVD